MPTASAMPVRAAGPRPDCQTAVAGPPMGGAELSLCHYLRAGAEGLIAGGVAVSAAPDIVIDAEGGSPRGEAIPDALDIRPGAATIALWACLF